LIGTLESDFRYFPGIIEMKKNGKIPLVKATSLLYRERGVWSCEFLFYAGQNGYLMR
jgi:hypothetical protein